jgi:formylglycine-generating enzyme required for sulfatase activity
MRLSFTLIGLLACGGAPVPEPLPPEPVVVEGMVHVDGGTVQLGPRHVLRAPPQVLEQGAHPARGQSYVSSAGMGLAPGFFREGSFWIDRYEVTQAQYAGFLEATGYRLPHVSESWAEDGWNWTSATASKPDHPVVLLSWYDARAYCQWAGKHLPSEAQWQLAALGPADELRRFPWGQRYSADKLNHGRMEPPNFDPSDGHERTAPVGSYPRGQSPSGLLDAFGNAWEYTSDARVDSWDEVVAFGPDRRWYPRASGLPLRVAVRGGSFYFDLQEPGAEWAAFSPEIRRKSAGVRCARTDPRK